MAQHTSNDLHHDYWLITHIYEIVVFKINPNYTKFKYKMSFPYQNYSITITTII